MDGTLLDTSSRLTEAVLDQLSSLPPEIGVFLASGRMLPSILPYYREMDLSNPVICYNGAKIVVPGKAPIYETALPSEIATAVAEYALSRNIQLNMYYEDQIYVFEKNDIGRRYAERFRVPLQQADRNNPTPLSRATKLLMIVDENDLLPTFEDLLERFGDVASLTTSSRRFVEVLPEGVNKGAALERLATYTGIPLERWVAAGDGRNDREMLMTAGLGVAMQNGDPVLHGDGNLVVPPLWDGGLQQVLDAIADLT